MKITVTFNLPEDRREHKIFNQAEELANAIISINQYILAARQPLQEHFKEFFYQVLKDNSINVDDL